jgi:hypothetical protein
MQRWAMILLGYHYDIEYRRSVGKADALSHLPLPVQDEPDDREIYRISYVDDLPVTSRDILKATRKDPVLSRVHDFVVNGWPSVVEDKFKPYFQRRSELSVDQNIVLWRMHVIVPTMLCSRILENVHEEHLGIV